MKDRDKIRAILFEVRKINKELEPLQVKQSRLLAKRRKLMDKITKIRLGKFGV